jgi:hypothetical protein
MKYGWWPIKAEKAKKIKRLYIPDDKVGEFWELIDAAKNSYTRWRLWKFIQGIFPEVDGKGWGTGSETVLHPYVEREEA